MIILYKWQNNTATMPAVADTKHSKKKLFCYFFQQTRLTFNNRINVVQKKKQKTFIYLSIPRLHITHATITEKTSQSAAPDGVNEVIKVIKLVTETFHLNQSAFASCSSSIAGTISRTSFCFFRDCCVLLNY